MENENTVEHKGIVSDIKDGIVYVDLLVQSACASCHAKGVCGADTAQKTIEVKDSSFQFSIGDSVIVMLKESLGIRAIFLGYLLPFIVVLSSLIIFKSLNFNDGLSALLSLSLLVPYYFILYLTRNNIKKKFNFSIKKNLTD
ncbi:MAG: SoxR reducing system RseC family protein [Bacteroidales bacterium]|nr:SoxR reducing system RseC family protein [Bacteroidales bacterium]